MTLLSTTMCQWIPALCPSFGAAAAGLHHEADLVAGVGLVVPEVGDLQELRPVELLRPVALLAGLPCRAQVLHRDRDRGGVGVERHGQHLARAGELRLHVERRSGARRGSPRSGPGVGGVLVGRELGLHDGVADPAAERDRLGEEEAVVAGDDQEENEQEPAHECVGELLALEIIVEIHPWIRRWRLGPELAPAAALPLHAVQDDDQPEEEEGREDHVGDDPEVRVGLPHDQLHQRRENNQKGAARDHEPAEVAQRVPVEPLTWLVFGH